MNNTEAFSIDNFISCYLNYSQPKPWTHPELNHGTALLHSEEGMNAYIAAYGEMHVTKCRVALQNFPLDLLKIYSFEIFDWGCGQSLASMCMIEKLQQRGLMHNLKRVTLFELSPETLNRANYNVSMMLRGNSKAININTINSYLPGTVDHEFTQHIDYQSHITIHLFSNVLDINSIDLKQLALSIANNERVQHIFLCIDPQNRGSNRIDLFLGNFRFAGMLHAHR